MKTLISAMVAVIVAIGSFSVLAHQKIQFTGLYQKSPGSNVWLMMKTRTIDPSAFRGHHIKMYHGGHLSVVKVVGTPYCTSSNTAVFELKPKDGKTYSQVVHFGKGHTCVKMK